MVRTWGAEGVGPPPNGQQQQQASKQVGLVRPNIQRKKHTLNHAGTATRTGITKARAKQQKTTNSACNAKTDDGKRQTSHIVASFLLPRLSPSLSFLLSFFLFRRDNSLPRPTHSVSCIRLWAAQRRLSNTNNDTRSTVLSRAHSQRSRRAASQDSVFDSTRIVPCRHCHGFRTSPPSSRSVCDRQEHLCRRGR